MRGGLRVMNADGSGERELSNAAVSPMFAPAWSPDGRRIAFVEQRGRGRERMEIYVVNADGSKPVRLTRFEGYDGHPAWGTPSSTSPP